MKTINVMGLGAVSRHTAAQIEICDTAGADEFILPVAVVRALQPLGYTEKEVRQAIFKLHRKGVLTRVAPGSYVWTKQGVK